MDLILQILPSTSSTCSPIFAVPVDNTEHPVWCSALMLRVRECLNHQDRVHLSNFLLRSCITILGARVKGIDPVEHDRTWARTAKSAIDYGAPSQIQA